MFLDREITSKLEAELQAEHIIIANDSHEFDNKQRTLRCHSWKGVNTIAHIVLDLLLSAWKGPTTTWEALKGTRVLDLGAGSGNSIYKGITGSYICYPQLARICAINGANVVAIDKQPQKGFDRELFEWAAADLVDAVLNHDLQNLPILQGRQFDIINSSNFLGANRDPFLQDQTWRKGRMLLEEFSEMLLSQAGKLLTEGGIMDLSMTDEKGSRCYTRQQREILRLPS